jgi:hypothetical protein
MLKMLYISVILHTTGSVQFICFITLKCHKCLKDYHLSWHAFITIMITLSCCMDVACTQVSKKIKDTLQIFIDSGNGLQIR